MRAPAIDAAADPPSDAGSPDGAAANYPAVTDPSDVRAGARRHRSADCGEVVASASVLPKVVLVPCGEGTGQAGQLRVSPAWNRLVNDRSRLAPRPGMTPGIVPWVMTSSGASPVIASW